MMSVVKLVFVVVAGVALLVLLTGCSRSSGGEPSATATAAPEGTTDVPTPSAVATEAVAKTTTTALSEGVTHGSLKFGGVERTFRAFVPRGLKSGSRVPLVVALHGGLGSGDQFALASRFERLAQDEGFVVVFPDGIGATWNGGGCCGQAARTNVDDVGFLAALIEQMEREAPVDPAKVFMTGHSNGAIMAFRFGCERGDLVKGIAPVAGSLEIPKCEAKTPTNLLAIHGDADQNHPINGGEGARSIAGVPFVSMEKTLALWTNAMGCGQSPQRSTSGALTTTDWKDCKGGTVARYIIIKGADHPWPGGPDGVQGSVASKELDATKAVWAFFKGL